MIRRHAPAWFALGLFLAFAALFAADHRLYLTVMWRWMLYVSPVPFGDTAFLTSELACWRAGADVYAANDCAPSGQVMVYSPLWLRLWFLPGGAAATIPLALTFVGGFIASLTVLPRIEGRTGLALTLAAIASPATAYAVDRANVDLAIFAIAALTVLAAERTLPVRVGGYALALFAGLLKFYPLTMLILIARERPKRATMLEAAALALIAVFALTWHDELARMFPNIPRPVFAADGVGGRRLAEAAVVWAAGDAHLAGTQPLWRAATVGIQGALTLLALLTAWLTARSGRFPAAFLALTGREMLCLTLGGALFCGCFVAGSSLIYREILLLLAFPALARFAREGRVAWPVAAAIWLCVFLMWHALPKDWIEHHLGRMTDASWPAPAFLFWLAGEIAAWWLFTVLLAALLCFVRLARDIPFAQSNSVST